MLDGMLPSAIRSYCDRARLYQEFGVAGDGYVWFCGVANGPSDWPQLVVVQRFDPGPDNGFGTGLLVVPDTSLVFLGAGTRLLCYSLEDGSTPRLLWEDVAQFGFWGWRMAGDRVLMSAELELAAWSLSGKKLWSMPVEPPWNLELTRDGLLAVETNGMVSAFRPTEGPQAPA